MQIYYIIVFILSCCISPYTLLGQDREYIKDSLINSVRANYTDDDAFGVIKDTTRLDSIKKDTTPDKPSALKSKVDYKALDYVQLDQFKKNINLYNKGDILYGDTQLKSGKITMNYASEEAYAGRIKDSLGNYDQLPYFKQAQEIIEPDSLRFNYKTKKALIWNSRTKQQNDTYIKSENIKKENDSIYYMRKAKVTTSKNIDNPEYYFLIQKAKLIPNKKIITGPINMKIADVPTPIWLPFSFFPMSSSRASGILFPSYGNSAERGFFLQNGGFYLPINDYIDATFTGDYYTNGSYGIRARSIYKLLYKFNGNLQFRLENLVTSRRGFPDYSKTSIYNIQWTHTQDPKASPNSRFSASVNFGSSEYYRESINQLNTPNALNNTLSSSVSYSRVLSNNPSINFTLSSSLQQNTRTETVNMSLPEFQFSVAQIFPFKPKVGAKKNILQNLTLRYTLSETNRVQIADSLLFTSKVFDNAKTGFSHKIPISTNVKVLKYLNLNFGSDIKEVWQFKTIHFNDYDIVAKENKKDTINGFDRFATYNFNSSLGTTIYGTFPFGDDKKIQSIRHTFSPSISFSHTPSFEDEYYDTYTDQSGNVREYSRFQEGPYGVPNKKKSNNIGFSVTNTFEAKVRDRDSTKIEPKKISLINSLNFSTSYNIEADSLKLSPISVTGNLALFNKKLNVNFNGSLDSYALSANGQRINTLNIDNGGSLFRLTRAGINLSYSLSSKNFEKNGNNKTDNKASGGRDDDLFGKVLYFGDSKSENVNSVFANNDEEKIPYYNYKIKWDISLTQSINYNNSNRQSELKANSLMFRGNITPTPSWRIGFSSGYDFDNHGFTYTQINLERDLKSWTMSFSWYPNNTNIGWNFFVGIKSSIFSDIKYEERDSNIRPH